jgi:predicted site-specific integrase-resolvase
MFLTSTEAGKRIGVDKQTIRVWHKTGKLIPEYVTQGGQRRYSEEQINAFLSSKQNKSERKVIGYCRVSSAKQKGDLERQIERIKLYLTAQGRPFEVIEDVGSGINYNKKGLQELIRLICRGEVEKVVVLYKDRLMRFGFDLFKSICEQYNTLIEIVDISQKTDQEELVEDLVQIVTVFSCKLQGQRAKKTKEMIKELVKNVQNNENTASADGGAGEEV